MKHLIYFLILLFISCSSPINKFKDGLYISKQETNKSEKKIDSYIMLVSNKKAYILDHFRIDTFDIKNNILLNHKQKLKLIIINDSILKINGKQYFNNKPISFIKHAYISKKQNLKINHLTNKLWYSNDFSLVNKMNRDTIFMFLNNKKDIYYYSGNIPTKDVSKGKWKFLNIEEFVFLKFDIPFPIYVFIDNIDNNHFEGFAQYMTNDTKKYKFYKKQDSIKFFQNIVRE